MPLIKPALYAGFVIPLVMLGVDYYMSPYREYEPTKLDLKQQQISKIYKPDSQSGLMNLLDESNGTLNLIGWDQNLENKIVVNYRDAKPVSSFALINDFKYRAFNSFFVHTPAHVIQLVFADFAAPMCPSQLIIMKKDNPKDTKEEVVEYFKCPEFDKGTLGIGNKTEISSGKIKANVLRKENTDKYSMFIEVQSIGLQANFEFNYKEVASVIWSTPLSDDKSTYFASLKKPGLSLTGSYKYKDHE